MARALCFRAVRPDCRGGAGVDAFHAHRGFKEGGRVREMINTGGGDSRDSIAMCPPLNEQSAFLASLGGTNPERKSETAVSWKPSPMLRYTAMRAGLFVACFL